MGKKLAIKGHLTRGNEIIELLEMIGGEPSKLNGSIDNKIYYIDDNGVCSWDFIGYEEIDKYKIFTLYEFYTKFPFKVGDKVFDIADGVPGIILTMKWDEDVSDMKYHVLFDNGDLGWYTNDTIDFYLNKDNKEMNRNIETNHSKVNGLKRGDEYPIMEGVECNDCIKYYFPDGYEFVDTDDTGVYLKPIKPIKPIKPKYPTTYEECWKVRFEVDGETILKEFHNVSGYYSEPLGALQKLLCCRDAYWKIAGEEMGLDKPWKPDWNNHNHPKFGIHNVQNNICSITLHVLKNLILVFPTEEMRDIFHENFKDLIEQCKELL